MNVLTTYFEQSTERPAARHAQEAQEHSSREKKRQLKYRSQVLKLLVYSDKRGARLMFAWFEGEADSANSDVTHVTC
jgi:hypothetical protein